MDSRRVLDIILEETQKTETRYPGYHAEMKTLVAEVVNLERQHKISTRTIKQDIAAQINTLGEELAEKLKEGGKS